MSSSKVRARLSRLNQAGDAVESLEVRFNPKDLTFSKSNNWKQNNTPKQNSPAIEFTGGGATSLKLQLHFDTYLPDATSDSSRPREKDVRKAYTNVLYGWTFVDPDLQNTKTKKGRPPSVRFQWGSSIFDGVISSISQRLTLFLPTDGTPVRAVVDLTLTQVKDELYRPSQNPTSGGVGGERVHVVREGDTLALIAYRSYNDSTAWRLIADANGLTECRRLTPGAVLVIPNA